jgi:transglutaminase-like putative cysteine protease
MDQLPAHNSPGHTDPSSNVARPTRSGRTGSLAALMFLVLTAPGPNFGRVPAGNVALGQTAARVDAPPAPSASPVESWFREDWGGKRAGWSLEVQSALGLPESLACWRSESLTRLWRMETSIELRSSAEYRPPRGDSAAELSYHLITGQTDTLFLTCRFDPDSLRVTKRIWGGVDRYARARTPDLLTPDRVSRFWREASARPRGDSAERPGGALRYDAFVPEMDAVVSFVVVSEGPDTLSLDSGRRPTWRWHTTCPILPALESREWRDIDGELWRSEVASVGLVTTRTTREDALIEGAGAEILATTFVHLDRPLDPDRTYRRVLYEVTVPAGSPPIGFGRTPQARIVSSNGPVSRVEVVRLLTPDAEETRANQPPGREEEWGTALRSTLLMEADAPAVREAARRAVGDETDRWRQACALESFVSRRISRKSLRVLFASATATLASGEGDCTEHAILLSALCRAVGIPARVVAGLVGLGPDMGYHLWTEVDAGAGWIGLDAALDRCPVDGRYLPLAASDLSDDSLAPLTAGVLEAAGRIRVRVLEVEVAPAP